MKRPLVKPPNAPKRFRGTLTALAVIAGLALAGLFASRLLAATSQPPSPSAEYVPAASASAPATVSEIPTPEPLPNLDFSPPARPLRYTLVRDPFPAPPPPPPPAAVSTPTRRRPAPPLPPANPIALFVGAKNLRYVGYVTGARPIGTFAYDGGYVVMFEGSRFPNSDVVVTTLTANRAVLSDAAGRRYVISRNQ